MKKKLKLCCLWVLLNINLWAFFVSCEQPVILSTDLKKNDGDSSYTAESGDEKRQHVLTAGELSSLFPNQLRGLKKTQVKLDQNIGTATLYYGTHQYEVTIIDDLKTNYSNVHSFYKKYRKPDSTQLIKSVRDGYKTLTVIQRARGTTSITFVFKKRYLIRITGVNKQTPYMVWRFLELNKLRSLPD